MQISEKNIKMLDQAVYKKHMSWESWAFIKNSRIFLTFFDQTRSLIHHISRIKGNLFDCLNRCIKTFGKNAISMHGKTS